MTKALKKARTIRENRKLPREEVVKVPDRKGPQVTQEQVEAALARQKGKRDV